MSFDLDHIKSKEGDHGSWWTSYADLFMLLSIVFLLMYVTSSLRQGTAGVQQQSEYKALAKHAAELEQQIKVYNTLKDQQLGNESKDEQQVYSKLMDKLSLLKEEAKDEKDSLRQQAKENEDKEFALNQYQQVIRNIINANVLAKNQIQHRDQIIVTKNEDLHSKDEVISAKQSQVNRMESELASNQNKISDINQQLAERIHQLSREQARAKSSKHALEQHIANLRAQGQLEIKNLEAQNQQVAQQLNQVKGALDETESKLGATESKLGATVSKLGVIESKLGVTESKLGVTESRLGVTESKLGATESKLGATAAKLQEEEQQKSAAIAQLEASKQQYQSKIQGLQAAHAKQLQAERGAFERNLARQHLSAQAKAKQLAGFADSERRKAAALAGELSGLNSKVRDTEARLNGAEQDKGRYLAQVAGLKKSNEEMSGDLERARTLANARRVLADRIADNFKKSGIKADVDGKTGQVTLDFGNEYFDSGSDALKPGMKSAIERFFPSYTRSLLSDARTADKIANVEIIGFASSTYKGRYVNPNSILPEDREAINYNLKLSFSRANSIFRHILGNNVLSTDYQKRFLPLVKVVGRGYLPDGKDGSDIPPGITEDNFCAKFNCKKAQRVIVKFNLKD